MPEFIRSRTQFSMVTGAVDLGIQEGRPSLRVDFRLLHCGGIGSTELDRFISIHVGAIFRMTAEISYVCLLVYAFYFKANK